MSLNVAQCWLGCALADFSIFIKASPKSKGRSLTPFYTASFFSISFTEVPAIKYSFGHFVLISFC